MIINNDHTNRSIQPITTRSPLAAKAGPRLTDQASSRRPVAMADIEVGVGDAVEAGDHFTTCDERMPRKYRFDVNLM